MPNDSATTPLRLVIDGDEGSRESSGPLDARLTSASSTPQVVMIPLEKIQPEAVCELAYEVARALAAQTARTGAIVFSARSGVPRARWRARRLSLRGSLAGIRLDPLAERDGVLFFETSQIAAVNPAVRGQMPQIAILPDHAADSERVFNATAVVVVVQCGARAEYVELLRGELAATQSRPVHVVQIEESKKHSRFSARSASSVRAQAWALAAELVLT